RRAPRHRPDAGERMSLRERVVTPREEIGDLSRIELRPDRGIRVRERSCGELIAAGRAAEPEIDPAGKERREHAELLRDLQRTVVAQHDAARADADSRRA